MLPLIPALILLLLNGPANIERLAEVGALPAALAAIQQRIDSPSRQTVASARADQLALASLLSMSADPQLSRALAQIFSIQVANEPVASVKPAELIEADTGEPPPVAQCIGKPHDGYLNSQRSRDGPLSC
jgi:hypothetical protein